MARVCTVWQVAFRNMAFAAVVALAVLPAVTGIPVAAAQEWKPDKSVEIIATNAPGGGSDRVGRIMIKILQEGRYVPTPINLVNKPGGGSSLAYNYVNQYPGNGHFLVPTAGPHGLQHILRPATSPGLLDDPLPQFGGDQLRVHDPILHRCTDIPQPRWRRNTNWLALEASLS